MVTSVAQFIKLTVDRVVAFGSQSLISIPHRRDMMREISKAQHEVKFGGAVLHIDGLFQFGGHSPPAPAVRDGCSGHIGMHDGELARNFASLALAVHINAAAIDRIL